MKEKEKTVPIDVCLTYVAHAAVVIPRTADVTIT